MYVITTALDKDVRMACIGVVGKLITDGLVAQIL
jgi:hypothetical protein